MKSVLTVCNSGRRNMERVISVSLSEWMAWLLQHDSASLTAMLMLGLFLILYGTNKWGTARREQVRLDRLDGSLEKFAAAQSALIRENVLQSPLPADEERLLLDRLLGCQAAPYITEDLLAQISAYAGDRDKARLPLLLKTLEREIDRLSGERDKLLARAENPGLGYALWKQFRPIIPFLFAISALYLISSLLQILNGERNVLEYGFEDQLNIWSHFGSAVFSLLLLYPALMDEYRPNAGTLLQRIWSLLISALFLLHLFGLTFAPYILTFQLLLFIAGFRFTASKPRKSRPYAGHDQTLTEIEPGPQSPDHDQ